VDANRRSRFVFGTINFNSLQSAGNSSHLRPPEEWLRTEPSIPDGTLPHQCCSCAFQKNWRLDFRFGSITHMEERPPGVRFTSKSGHRRGSLDHLVGGSEQRRRKLESERLGGFEIDYQVEFGGLAHRHVGGLFAL